MEVEWNKTKTIFILAFLVLDIFLAVEFFELRSKSNYDIMQEATIEEKLAAENISYSNLPKNEDKSYYITAKSKDFTVEEVKKVKGNQTLVLSSNISETFRSLTFELEKPYQLPDVNMESKVSQFLKENVMYGENYYYWYEDVKENAIICVQKFNNYPIFQAKEDHIGMVILYLNEDNQIIYYEQSMLEDIKEVDDKESAVPALKAIEALYNKNFLKANSRVDKIRYGYYTHIPLSNQQILAPTWHIAVETESGEVKDFYVNAIEGDVLESTN